jgi:hypothetical protein
VLLATSPLQPFTPAAFGLYGAMNVVEALRITRRHGLRFAPIVALIFPVLHASHGVGFGVGLVQYVLKPDWPEGAHPLGSFASSPVANAPQTAVAPG